MDEAAEEGTFERGQDRGRVGAHGFSHLGLQLLPARLEHVGRKVRATHDVVRREEGPELGVLDDDPDVPELPGRLRQPCEHSLPGTIESLHVADLHDLSGAALCLDDAVRVRKGDAHRLLDEDVEAVLEGVQRGLCVRL